MIGRILHLGFKGDAPTAPEVPNRSDGDEDEEHDNAEERRILSKEELWGIMEKRFHDVSSYTRSKLIQSWIYLCEYVAIPLVHSRLL
jgi:hypothetical protein